MPIWYHTVCFQYNANAQRGSNLHDVKQGALRWMLTFTDIYNSSAFYCCIVQLLSWDKAINETEYKRK